MRWFIYSPFHSGTYDAAYVNDRLTKSMTLHASDNIINDHIGTRTLTTSVTRASRKETFFEKNAATYFQYRRDTKAPRLDALATDTSSRIACESPQYKMPPYIP